MKWRKKNDFVEPAMAAAWGIWNAAGATPEAAWQPQPWGGDGAAKAGPTLTCFTLLTIQPQDLWPVSVPEHITEAMF